MADLRIQKDTYKDEPGIWFLVITNADNRVVKHFRHKKEAEQFVRLHYAGLPSGRLT